jgi:hypothetical protein
MMRSRRNREHITASNTTNSLRGKNLLHDALEESREIDAIRAVGDADVLVIEMNGVLYLLRQIFRDDEDVLRDDQKAIDGQI